MYKMQKEISKFDNRNSDFVLQVYFQYREKVEV